jgi:asparagine synthase (glutamine-hydrolysing)
MCGIAGTVDLDGPVDEGALRRMCDAMVHRGPDARGIHVEPGVGLGSQRLAIIDVAGGDQPIFNEDGTVAVVLNGEIYNFPELRADLERRGHRFATRSDTEVLVHLYEDHGRDLVDHLRGMFAFALWDRRRRTLLLGRDRVGKKPLFYHRRGRRLTFASELAALIEDPEVPREPDPAAIDAYLALQYVPDPLCAFAGVRKLPPASVLTFDETGVDVSEYWRLRYEPKLAGVPEPEIHERLRAELAEATRIRLISEVPLGAFLSGGIDSSAVVAAMAQQMSEPVRTFSISFTESAYDETPYARLVAERFGTVHEEFRVEPSAIDIMPRLARHYGEPFGDASAIPSFYLAEMTSRHVTVALNGDGGDESFAGYGRYRRAETLRRFDVLPGGLRRAAGGVGQVLAAAQWTPGAVGRQTERAALAIGSSVLERYVRGMSAWDDRRRARLLRPDFAALVGEPTAERMYERRWAESDGLALIDRLLALDERTYLPGDLLVKMDIATMAHSVEARSPLLDHRLMEFAAGLPADLKLRRGDGKHVLKAAMRGVLPDEVLDREKKGFSVPLRDWFRGPLRALPETWLLDPGAKVREWCRPAEIERTIREHREGAVDHALRLWVLVQLESWWRHVAAPTSVVRSAA